MADSFANPAVRAECLEFVKDVVRASGEIVKEGFRNRTMKVETKTAFYDLVTEYDQKTEEYLVAALRKKYPDHKFIAEESSSASQEKDVLTGEPTWIIDPIDGTTNFVHGLPLIAIGVALSYDKQIVLAVSFNPLLDEMFSATLGGGAFYNGQPMHTNKARSLKESVIADETSIASLPKCTDRVLGRTLNTVQKVKGLRALGSAVLTLAYVAAGRLDAYTIEFLKPWDIAGGTLLIQEAGGIVRDSRTGGEFDIMNPNVVVAATKELYEELWQIIQETRGKKLVLQ